MMVIPADIILRAIAYVIIILGSLGIADTIRLSRKRVF